MGDAKPRRDEMEVKIPEETMRKSLILALTAIGGGVGYAAGVTEVATGPSTDDPSTWRWHVSSILAAQSDTSISSAWKPSACSALRRSTNVTSATRPLGLPQPRNDSR